MNARAQEMVLAWQHGVDEVFRRQTGLSPGQAGPLSGPPPGLNPQQLATWWRDEVSDVDKLRYVNERPDLVAGLDGLPADVRDQANRTLLEREREHLRAEIASERAEAAAARGPGGDAERLTADFRADQLQAKLDGLDTLATRIGAWPPIDKDGYFLLGYDSAGDGRAIVAHGNPDTAANVATYVPGTNSSLGNLGLLFDQSNAMYDSANRVGPANSSVITWLGYDAPFLWEAASESYAVDANQSLDRFQQGLDTVNPDAHHTLVGHSYGSLVVGHAARDGDLPVDEILAIASPGMGVDTAAQLNVPPDKVWVIEDNQDPVADVPGQVGWFGTDPGDDAFGANQLPAEPEGRHPSSLHELITGGFNGPHLDYFWNWPSSVQAHENIGDIIANRDPTHR